MQQKYIKLEKPCSENWEKMTPNTKGAYCDLCAKNVIDFTQLSAFEIGQQMQVAKGNVCARLTTAQLTNPFFESEEYTRSNKEFPYSKIAAGLILASSLVVSQPTLANEYKVENSIEQTQVFKTNGKDKKHVVVATLNDDFTLIKGKVLSENENQAVSNASITFVTTQKLWVTHTLKDGTFSLKIPSDLIDDDNVIRISYEKVAYKSKEEYFFGFETEDLVLTKKEIHTPISITATPVQLILGGISSYPLKSEVPLVIKNGVQIPFSTFSKDHTNRANFIYFNSTSGIALFGEKAKYGLYLSVDNIQVD